MARRQSETSTGGRQWGAILLVAVPAVTLLPATGTIAMMSLPLPIGIAVTACAGAAHAGLIGLRRAPTATLLLTVGLIAVQAALTGLFVILPSTALILIALHAAAAYGERSVATAVAVFAPALATVRYAVDPSVNGSGFGPAPWLLGVALLAVCAVALLMGLLRRTELRATALLEDRLDLVRRAQAHREQQAAAAERSRISSELHDVLGHSLTVIVSQARVARFTPQRSTLALEVIEETARVSLQDLRRTLLALRDRRSDASSETPTAEPAALAERMRALGLSVDRLVLGTPRLLDPDAELALHRFLQEGLTNALRHGTGRLDWVEDWSDDHVTVRLSNPVGRTRHAGGGTGLGLPGMRARITAAGGVLEVASGDPFTVTARLNYQTIAARRAETVS